MCNWIPFYYIFIERDGCEQKKKNEAIPKMKRMRSMCKPAGERVLKIPNLIYSIIPGTIMSPPQVAYGWIALGEHSICV